jgi:hypothetical protein
MSDRLKREIVVKALMMAIWQRNSGEEHAIDFECQGRAVMPRVEVAVLTTEPSPVLWKSCLVPFLYL